MDEARNTMVLIVTVDLSSEMAQEWVAATVSKAAHPMYQGAILITPLEE